MPYKERWWQNLAQTWREYCAKNKFALKCKMTSWLTSVLYKIYEYTKNYTKPIIFYTNYMLYDDAIIIRVIWRIDFQSFCVDFAERAKEVFGNYEIIVLNFK